MFPKNRFIILVEAREDDPVERIVATESERFVIILIHPRILRLSSIHAERLESKFLVCILQESENFLSVVNLLATCTSRTMQKRGDKGKIASTIQSSNVISNRDRPVLTRFLF
jgi:hypothetical protein